jgi:hypothetical protein
LPGDGRDAVADIPTRLVGSLVRNAYTCIYRALTITSLSLALANSHQARPGSAPFVQVIEGKLDSATMGAAARRDKRPEA